MNNWLNIGTASLISIVSLTHHTALAPIAQAAPLELAQIQRELTGECRQVNDDIVNIYGSRSESSEIVMGLSRGDQVILGEADSLGGWIAVQLPNQGFVQARYLTDCGRELSSEKPDLNAPNTLCVNYRVDSTIGLNVYTLPHPDAEERDRVYPAERISVVGSPRFSEDTQTEWLRINHPIDGWIENGNPDTRVFNTTLCSELGL